MTDEQWVTESKWPRERVRAKVRYARLLFEEAQKHGAHGDDFDYAHEEGCLAHLDGVIDAFLQEVNVCLKLGLDIWNVSRWSVDKALKKTGTVSKEFDELTGLLDDKTSWLSEAREYRNQAIHRAAVSRNHLIIVGDSSKIQFRNPKTGVVHTSDRLNVVSSWIDSTEALFEKLGEELRAGCRLPKL